MSREQRFEQLIHENKALIHKVCRIYSITKDDRDDLFQEIVIQLWKAFNSFRAESKFSTWLYRIALNTAISGLRKAKRADLSGADIYLVSDTDDIPDGPVNEENYMKMYAAITLLNKIDKAIVMLYLEDRSYAEMEEILGMSYSNLRVKMTRIREKLKVLTK